MNEYQKMLAGKAFDVYAPEIAVVRDRVFLVRQQINHSIDFQESQRLIKKLFKQMGEGSLVIPPFNCEFGNVSVGRKCYLNMGITMLDGADIIIGNHVMIGPGSQFYTPSHATNPLERRQWETICKPVRIEDDVWIGGQTVINQGVTIGARSIVAANSVVNQDVPPDCIVGGTPAKVIKSLVFA